MATVIVVAAIDRAHLPKNTDHEKCAGCRKTEGEMMACSGCLIRTNGYIA